MSDSTQTILSGFRDRFAAEADGLWFGPGRVNLIGEHTDYNDGFVFPFAINRRAVVALAVRDDRMLRPRRPRRTVPGRRGCPLRPVPG